MEQKALNQDFAHLHVHTEFSLLDGAARIKKLVARAKELGMQSLAITDHGTMFGVINFYKECKKQGIKPIIGCEVYVAPGSRFANYEVEGVRYHHLILLAKNEQGYKNLTKLVSLGSIEGMYYKPRIDKELLRKYHQGLICLSACIAGELPQAIVNNNPAQAEEVIQEFMDIFGKDDYYLEVQNHGIPEEKMVAQGLFDLAHKYQLKTVATNDLHYVKQEDNSFHDVLLCIQMGRTLDDPQRMKFYNDQYYLKSKEEMYQLFPNHPECIDNTLEIAAKCNVEFTFGQLHLPNFPLPDNLTDTQYLRQLCEEKLPERYEIITDEIKQRLDYELNMIKQMGYDSYFLIVWDFINAARTKGIPVGPGRGSAAGSIVAYILGITNIDPLPYNLLFERFLNPERVTMPDIDIDFCYIRRDEVIQYVKERYGVDHVAQIITFGTMAAKGAIRDVGRVMNLPFGEVDNIAKLIPKELGITIDKALEEVDELAALYEAEPQVKQLIDYARAIEGMPRHSSTHAAGVVIAKDPVTDYVPIQLTEGTFVTQYDKDYVEELGLLKMDFLGLRTLTIIAQAVENIQRNRHLTIDIEKIPLVDKKTAAMLCRGDTCGVFQMESSGMTALMKELQPEGFDDLIPLVALFRPGPLGSGMATDFIERRHGRREVKYLHPKLEPILRETFGVVLYQEQVMQIVQVLAGFTLGQADILRRAMGKKKHDVLMSQKENFLAGCKANNIDEKLADTIFDLLMNFADYGFNKSHSVAYAYIAWQTAYLMAHYPAEFMAAMLTSLMTSDKIGHYLEKCKHLNIKILPPDINESYTHFTVQGDKIRFGLAAVKAIGETAIDQIVAERKAGGNFTSLQNFCNRVPAKYVNKRSLENLIKCGAFDTLGHTRAELLIVMEQAMAYGQQAQKDYLAGQGNLFGLEPEENDFRELLPATPVPELPKRDLLNMEKEITGFYITGHPLDEYANKINNLPTIADLATMEEGKKVLLPGIIRECKRINTKKGDTMCVIQLEDFNHLIEVVVFPKVFYQYMKLIMLEQPVAIWGKINQQEQGAKLLAEKITLLDEYQPKIYLQITPENQRDDQFWDSLKDILESEPGHIPVYLYHLANRQTIKTTENFWVNSQGEQIDKIKELIGDSNFKQV